MVCNDPAKLVIFAVAPKQAADLPELVAGTAMRAAGNLAPPLDRKFDHVAGFRLHGGNKVNEAANPDCDRILNWLINMEMSAI